MSNVQTVNSNTNFNIGCGSFLVILGLIFTTLKLTGVITWPWVWVLSPFIIAFALTMLIICLFILFLIVAVLWNRNE